MTFAPLLESQALFECQAFLESQASEFGSDEIKRLTDAGWKVLLFR